MLFEFLFKCMHWIYRFNLKLLVYMHGRNFTQLPEYPPLEMNDFQFVWDIENVA